MNRATDHAPKGNRLFNLSQAVETSAWETESRIIDVAWHLKSHIDVVDNDFGFQRFPAEFAYVFK